MDSINRHTGGEIYDVRGLTAQETLIISTRRVHTTLGKKVETLITVDGQEVLRFN